MIGIDYTAAYEQAAGIGRLVRQLIGALAEEDTETRYKLFVSGATHAQLPPLPGQNFRWYPTRVTPLWFARLWYRARLYWPVECFIGQVKLYHATDFSLPPTLPGTKTLLTVHDLSFVRTPEATHPILKRYLDKVVPWSVRRADHVLADSHATRQDLIDIYDTPPEKITTLWSGVDEHFRPVTDENQIQAVRQKYQIPEGDYILSVGTVHPRKNYARVVEALHHLGKDFQHINLVLVSAKTRLDAPVYQRIQDLQMQNRVHFTGFVDDDDIPALYGGAILTAYPSLYEGFGFPILESMACGTPVVTGNLSSMPEIAGDAAIIVDPYDTAALADGIYRLLTDTDLRVTLIQKGYTQVAQFTWQKAARRLKIIYERLLNGD